MKNEKEVTRIIFAAICISMGAVMGFDGQIVLANIWLASGVILGQM